MHIVVPSWQKKHRRNSLSRFYQVHMFEINYGISLSTSVTSLIYCRSLFCELFTWSSALHCQSNGTTCQVYGDSTRRGSDMSWSASTWSVFPHSAEIEGWRQIVAAIVCYWDGRHATKSGGECCGSILRLSACFAGKLLLLSCNSHPSVFIVLPAGRWGTKLAL